MSAGTAEAAFWAAFLRNRNVEAATAGDGAVAVAGGYALFVAGTLIDYAVGAGSARPLRDDDLTVAESFYAARGAPARFEVEASVLERDAALLSARGYAEFGPTLAGLEATIGPPAAPGGIPVRTTTDRARWADLVARAAADTLADSGLLLRTAAVNAAAAHALVIATVDGNDAGAAALGITSDTALLYSAAVLPGFRGRGVHRALLAARLGIAHQRGTGRAVFKTAPDSPAERSAAQFAFVRTGLLKRVYRDT
jgi:GNAT superfamily N-acetyltransferase